ncbi:MAG: acyl-CoA thioesterase [Promethearchaeota archaeon]
MEERPMTFEADRTEVRVRFSETDAMGVVHFNRYFLFFEEGFVSFLNSLGTSPAEHLERDVVFPIVEAHCTYKESAKFGDTVVIVTRIEHKTHSLVCHHEVYRKSDDALLAHGKLVRVCYNTREKVKVPVASLFKTG